MVTLMEFHGYLYPCLTHIKPKFLLCRNQESNQVHNQVHNQAIYQEMIFFDRNISTNRNSIPAVRWARRPTALLGTVARAPLRRSATRDWTPTA